MDLSTVVLRLIVYRIKGLLLLYTRRLYFAGCFKFHGAVSAVHKQVSTKARKSNLVPIVLPFTLFYLNKFQILSLVSKVVIYLYSFKSFLPVFKAFLPVSSTFLVWLQKHDRKKVY